jgi:dsDNA-binding SOS-regulon protein
VDASKDDEVVVNTAARNNDGVNRYGSMFDDKLNEFGWPFISLFLINQQRDSCEMLTEYMNVVKHGRIHVVRNRFFGLAPSLFELYDNSPLRKAVEERQGLSLFLPQLATRVTNLVQSSRLTLERARETATLGSRAEIERWRRECALNIFDKVCDDFAK